MTFLRYLFLGLLAFVLLVLALANRQMVTLRLVPEGLSDFVGFGTGPTLPMFVVILLSVAIGLLIGFTWEWLREHKHRAEARAERAKKERLEKELARTRATASDEDEVLALLDGPR
ncbi:LapA family protein [Jannaschia ovalis]|uniref:LapA family protein n=1 Tax=Jannaschia ovalis TaxID=3038773 RepID=A0ABY8L8T1_9RHOB|nr:LapA family protein [Jannaschia sp. GRR-S6-38]WGH77772.1 LapA family protein [Jannaschia sp. GRR-S6-38]